MVWATAALESTRQMLVGAGEFRADTVEIQWHSAAFRIICTRWT